MILWLVTFRLLLVVHCLQYVQVSENHPASLVVLHRPDNEVFFGGLHPSGHLFEEKASVSRSTAQEAHNTFVNSLREAGVPLIETIEDILSRDRVKLITAAKASLTFHNTTTISRPDLLTENYKHLEHYTNSELFNIILLQPTVTLSEATRNTPLVADYTKVRPLSNLVFTRDQQIVTAKGLIIASLNSPQRQEEVKIMEVVWEILGVPILGKIQPPAHLEGGDFIPLSHDLCLISIGLRTNMEAVQYLLDNDLFGTKRVGVVVDEHDKSQDRMHLDTVFNVVDSKRVVLLEDVYGPDSPIHRVVKLYIKGEDGQYHLEEEVVEFSNFLIKEGYQIIKVTNEQQLQYMCNFLNLGPVGKYNNGIIISVNPGLEDLLKKNGYAGTVKYINYRAITQMYGAAHCTSQVFREVLQNPKEEL